MKFSWLVRCGYCRRAGTGLGFLRLPRCLAHYNFQESAKYQERILNFTSLVSQFAVSNGFKLDMQAYLQETLRSLPLASLTLEVARSAVTLFGDFFLMALFVIYMLAGIDYTQPKSKMQQHMSDQISRYLVAKLLLSSLTGNPTWLKFSWLIRCGGCDRRLELGVGTGRGSSTLSLTGTMDC